MAQHTITTNSTHLRSVDHGSVGVRTLHLLDIEYLGCGPSVSARDVDLVLHRYEPLVGCADGDHFVAAASHWVYKRIAFDLGRPMRFRPAGSGPDAADMWLIEDLAAVDVSRYSRVVIGSGDGRFAECIRAVQARGVPVWVAGYGFNTSRKLLVHADRFVDLEVHAAARVA